MWLLIYLLKFSFVVGIYSILKYEKGYCNIVDKLHVSLILKCGFELPM